MGATHDELLWRIQSDIDFFMNNGCGSAAYTCNGMNLKSQSNMWVVMTTGCIIVYGANIMSITTYNETNQYKSISIQINHDSITNITCYCTDSYTDMVKTDENIADAYQIYMQWASQMRDSFTCMESVCNV